MTEPTILTFCGKTVFAIGGYGASIKLKITNESMDAHPVEIVCGHSTLVVGDMAGGAVESYEFLVDEHDAKQSPDNTVAVMTTSGMIVSTFSISPYEAE